MQKRGLEKTKPKARLSPGAVRDRLDGIDHVLSTSVRSQAILQTVCLRSFLRLAAHFPPSLFRERMGLDHDIARVRKGSRLAAKGGSGAVV